MAVGTMARGPRLGHRQPDVPAGDARDRRRPGEPRPAGDVAAAARPRLPSRVRGVGPRSTRSSGGPRGRPGSGFWARLVNAVMARPVLLTVSQRGAPARGRVAGPAPPHRHDRDHRPARRSIDGIAGIKLINEKFPFGQDLRLDVVVTEPNRDGRRSRDRRAEGARRSRSHGIWAAHAVRAPVAGRRRGADLASTMTGGRNDEANRDDRPAGPRRGPARRSSATLAADGVEMLRRRARRRGRSTSSGSTPTRRRGSSRSCSGCQFLLMLVAFRSIVIPIKAILLNLLSTAAAFGVMVLVFQEGWFAEPLGIVPGGVIESWVPIFIFTILFGLSMDYHLFILTRIKEARDRGLDSRAAVARGHLGDLGDDHERGLDHGRRLRGVRDLQVRVHPAARARAGGRGLHRRDAHPERPPAGDDDAARRLELVAAALARLAAARDDRGRVGEPEELEPASRRRRRPPDRCRRSTTSDRSRWRLPEVEENADLGRRTSTFRVRNKIFVIGGEGAEQDLDEGVARRPGRPARPRSGDVRERAVRRAVRLGHAWTSRASIGRMLEGLLRDAWRVDRAGEAARAGAANERGATRVHDPTRRRPEDEPAMIEIQHVERDPPRDHRPGSLAGAVARGSARGRAGTGTRSSRATRGSSRSRTAGSSA